MRCDYERMSKDQKKTTAEKLAIESAQRNNREVDNKILDLYRTKKAK